MIAPTPGHLNGVRPTQTPWGPAQNVTAQVSAVAGYSGVFWVTTANHGGLWIAPPLRSRMPIGWRRAYFEEDCEWCIPFLILGCAAKGTPEYKRAEECLRYWYPDLVPRILGN